MFVPDGKVKHFLKRFASYAKSTPKTKGERRHEDMLDPVAALQLATLRGLWTDSTEVYPDETRPSGGRSGCGAKTATSSSG